MTHVRFIGLKVSPNIFFLSIVYYNEKKPFFTMFTHFSNVGNVTIFAGNMQTQNLF